jgi:hypothetical protein
MMIDINATFLFWTGISLLFLFSLLKANADRKEGKRFELLGAICGLGKTVGVTALIAALLIFVLTSLTRSDPSERTLKELNESIDSLKEWLDRSWMVSIPITLAILASIVHVTAKTAEFRTKALGYFIRITSTTKLIVEIMACFSFVSVGAVSLAGQQLDKAISAVQDNRQAQLFLSKSVELLIRSEAIEALVQASSPAESTTPSTQDAYDKAATYLPYQLKRQRGHLFVPKDSEEKAIASDDASLADVNAMQADVDKQISNEDKLVRDLVDISYDRFVADSITKFVFHTENPLLNELIGIVSDAAYAEKLKNFSQQQVKKLFHSDLSLQSIHQLRLLAATFGRGIAESVLQHPVSATPPTSSALGEPKWDQMRTQVGDDVAQANFSDEADGRKMAKEAVTQFDQVWQATHVLLAGAADRNVTAESAFGNYLVRNPDYAAVWSIEMMRHAPPEYTGDLQKLGLSDIEYEMPSIKDAAKSAKDGDDGARKVLESLGLSVDDVDTLSDQDICQKVHKRLLLLPADGYVLYFQETKTEDMELAYRYFNSTVSDEFSRLAGPGDFVGAHPEIFKSLENAASDEERREHPDSPHEGESEVRDNKPVEAPRVR